MCCRLCVCLAGCLSEVQELCPWTVITAIPCYAFSMKGYNHLSLVINNLHVTFLDFQLSPQSSCMVVPPLWFIRSWHWDQHVCIPLSVPTGSHGFMWLPIPSTDVLTTNNVDSPVGPSTSLLHILHIFSPLLHLRELTGFFMICFKYRSTTEVIGTRLNHRSLFSPSPLPSPTTQPCFRLKKCFLQSHLHLPHPASSFFECQYLNASS